jgi:hypothetical protein
MATVELTKTNFSAGEISPLLFGRGDLRAYENGAAKLTNVFIHPTGGVTRRTGLRFIDKARGRGRLVPFEFSTEQVYLLVFTDGYADVYANGNRVGGFATPWTEAQLRQINWTQSADTLLVVHPDVPPKTITRRADAAWDIADWTFLTKSDRIAIPHYKFANPAVTLQPSATTGAVSVTASAPVFLPEHLGARIRIEDRELQITNIQSATLITANVKQTLRSTTATQDWSEQAFSSARGWPTSVCFHQDRLVIGGSRDLPNYLWLSRSDDLFNFELGQGLDDEAMQFPLLSDQVNAIRHVFSGRHLQVFTSGAEWMVSGEPLTPTNIQVHRQTRIGSPLDRSIPPRDVDGATMFVSRTDGQLREFLFTDSEQAYQAADLGMLAPHVLVRPVDMDYDARSRLLHVVRGDGKLATLTVYRDEQVGAWTVQETDGAFIAIGAVGDWMYVLVERRAGVFVEMFDKDLQVDAGLSGTSDVPTQHWTGADHLEGEVVKVVADGAPAGDYRIEGGGIVLDNPGTTVQLGLPFVHVIEPLPLATFSVGGRSSGPMRPISLTFRLIDTGAFRLDSGRGFREISFRRLGKTKLNEAPRLYCGDKTVRAIGWRRGSVSPMWRVEQDTPLPFTLLSVSTTVSLGN